MNRWKNRLFSLREELSALIVLAAGVAVVVGVLANYGGESFAQYWVEENNYIYESNRKMVEEFREYITENNVSYRDSDVIDAWIHAHGTPYIEIYKDSVEVYNPYYSMDGSDADTAEPDFSDMPEYVFQVRFSDADTEIFAIADAVDLVYNNIFYASIFLAVLVFFVIILLGIRRIIAYIQQLEQEIHLLEGGNLDYPITVSGRDELSSMAGGLEQMRVALKQRIDNEEQLMEASQQFVSTMAHDIRTPLTTMLLYTEILKQHKFQDDAQMNAYLDKISAKATQINDLSNHLLEHFHMPQPGDVRLEAPRGMRQIFEPMFEDLVSTLESDGFTVHNAMEFRRVRVAVCSEYMARIMDNIVSNLQKYAQKEQAIELHTDYSTEYVVLCFENAIAAYNPQMPSTGIGILNVKRMMREMNGSCAVSRGADVFSLSLKFPVMGAEEKSDALSQKARMHAKRLLEERRL